MQVVVPAAMAADKAGVVYVVDTPETPGSISVVRRYRPSSGSQDVLANAGDLKGTSTSFMMSQAVSVDASGHVLLGDDPTGGTAVGQGHLWKVTPPAV